MLFNSIEFLLLLPLVFALYWAMNRWTGERSGLRAQNLLHLFASCGWWDWRFLGLIAFSTAVECKTFHLVTGHGIDGRQTGAFLVEIK